MSTYQEFSDMRSKIFFILILSFEVSCIVNNNQDVLDGLWRSNKELTLESMSQVTPPLSDDYIEYFESALGKLYIRFRNGKISGYYDDDLLSQPLDDFLSQPLMEASYSIEENTNGVVRILIRRSIFDKQEYTYYIDGSCIYIISGLYKEYFCPVN